MAAVAHAFSLAKRLQAVDGGLYLIGYMRDEGKAPSKYNPQAECAHPSPCIFFSASLHSGFALLLTARRPVCKQGRRLIGV